MINKQFQEALMDECLDESTKIIRYLQEQEQKQKPYNLTMLVITIISAIGAVTAAICSIFMFFL